MMAYCVRMAEPPDFTVAANGLSNAAAELRKMQNLPVVNVAEQLNRIEQTQLGLLRELRDLRRDLTRAYE
jgi:hypothetical protein